MDRERVEELIGFLFYLAVLIGVLLFIASLQTPAAPGRVRSLIEEHNAAIESAVAELDPPVSRSTVEPTWVTFKVTAYCPCAECCGKMDGITKSGRRAQEGVTVAADPSVLPLGSTVEIEGLGLRSVQDTGGAIDGLELDLFFDSHEAALEFGVQYLKVRVIE